MRSSAQYVSQPQVLIQSRAAVQILQQTCSVQNMLARDILGAKQAHADIA